MKRTAVLLTFALLGFGFVSCDNALQLALPGLLTTRTPVTTPAPGVYDHDLEEIVLSSQTEGAEIYYTTDNTSPTRESTRYTGPLSLTGHQKELYLRAIAFKEGKDPSPEMTASFYIEHSGPLPPAIRVEGANQRSDGTWDGDITLSIDPELTENSSSDKWTASALKLAYTLDGTLPIVETDTGEDSSGVVNGSSIPGNVSTNDLVTVTGEKDVTIRIASYVLSDKGYPISEVISRTFRVRYDQTITEEPLFSESGGAKAAGFDLNLTAPASYSLSYQLSGVKGGLSFVNPVVETGSSSDIPVFQEGNLQNRDSLTVRAWLTKDQWQPGPEKTITYTYNTGKPMAPVIRAYSESLDQEYSSGSKISGRSESSVRIYLSADSGSDIYYTTNGSIPTRYSTLYNPDAGIAVDNNVDYFRVDAIACRGDESSAISSAWYEVDHSTFIGPSAPSLAPSYDTGLSNSDNITNNANVTLTGTCPPGQWSVRLKPGNDSNEILASASSSGGTYSFTGVDLAEGTNPFIVEMFNASGILYTSSESTITSDRTPPEAPSPPALSPGDNSGVASYSTTFTDNITYITDVTLEGTSSTDTVQVTVFGGEGPLSPEDVTFSGTGYSFVTPLEEGNNGFSAVAMDMAGNLSATTEISQIVLDSVAPVGSVSLISQAVYSMGSTEEHGTFDGEPVRLHITSSDSGSGLHSYTYDNTSDAFPGSASASLTETEDVEIQLLEQHGEQTISVIITDRAGNSRTLSDSLTVLYGLRITLDSVNVLNSDGFLPQHTLAWFFDITADESSSEDYPLNGTLYVPPTSFGEVSDGVNSDLFNMEKTRIDSSSGSQTTWSFFSRDPMDSLTIECYIQMDLDENMNYSFPDQINPNTVGFYDGKQLNISDSVGNFTLQHNIHFEEIH